MGSYRVLLVPVIAAAFVVLAAAEEESCTVPTQRVQCGALTCNRTTLTCGPCVEDSECWEGALQCVEGLCKMKPLAATLSFATVVAGILGVLVCAIAVVAGVGGGGILVPLYATLLDVPMVVAVAVSQATIAGQSFSNVLLLLKRHHPDHQPPKPTRPVINFDYLTMMLPISLAGTLLGSVGSKMASDWMRVVLLYAILTNVLVRVVKKAREQRKADAEAAANGGKPAVAEEMQVEDKRVYDPSLELGEGKEHQVMSNNASFALSLCADLPMEGGAILEGYEETEEPDDGTVPPLIPQLPQQPLTLLLGSFVALFVTNLLRVKFTTCGTAPYWMIFTITNAALVGLYLYARDRLKTVWEKVTAGELPKEQLTFKWSNKTTIVFPMLAVFAGGAASMLGIGGGLVLSFLLLEAGLVPKEVSATGGFATLLVAAASGLLYVILGQLPLDFGLLFFVVGVVSTGLGRFVFVKEIERRNWQWMIVASLAVIIGGSMLAITAFGIYNTIVILQHDGYLGLGKICKAH